MQEHDVKRCLRIAAEIERAALPGDQRAAQIAAYWRDLSRYYWRPNTEPPAQLSYPMAA
jgi:hypothetical protein